MIDVRITANLIEEYSKGPRIMSQQRPYGRQMYSTYTQHLPPYHQWVADWSPVRFLNWGSDIGSHTRSLIDVVLKNRNPVQQGFLKGEKGGKIVKNLL